MDDESLKRLKNELNSKNIQSPISTLSKSRKETRKKRNKGEMGEVLTLALLLDHRKEILSNKLQVRHVASVVFNDITFSNDSNELVINKNGKTYRKDIQEFLSLRNLALESRANNKKRDGNITNLSNFLLLDSNKSGCQNKEDIQVKFEKSDLEGYSIKTVNGAAPTLVNASGQAQFEYEVPFQKSVKLETVESQARLKDKILELLKLCDQPFSAIKSLGTVSETYSLNLSKVDLSFAKSLGQYLINAHSSGDKKFKQLEKDEKKIKLIKDYLVKSCLGMVPSHEYVGNGINKGMIILSDRYLHFIEDEKDLANFLFEHCGFDTPSTSRHPMISQFRVEGGKLKFKITLQIRMTCPNDLFRIV